MSNKSVTSSVGGASEEEEETCLIENAAGDVGDGDNVSSGSAGAPSSLATASNVLVKERSGSESSIASNKNRRKNKVSPKMSDGEGEHGDRHNPLMQNDVLSLAKTIMDVSKDDDGQLPPAADLDQLTLHQVKQLVIRVLTLLSSKVLGNLGFW